MKTKRSAIVVLVACVLLCAAHEALAFYNPQTGRWLSRDPLIADRGFTKLHSELIKLVLPNGRIQTGDYEFTSNQPTTRWDYLGLASAGGGVTTRGVLEHHSYLTFTVKCPKYFMFVFDYVDYSGAAPSLENEFGKKYVDDLAGAIPPAAGLGGYNDHEPHNPNPSGVNCNGFSVTMEVFMRTRFASLTFGTASGAAAYAAGTIIHYHCDPCKCAYYRHPTP